MQSIKGENAVMTKNSAEAADREIMTINWTEVNRKNGDIYGQFRVIFRR